MLEEGVSDHRHERVTMKTLPEPPFEVVEAKFLFQLLMGLLADPSGLDCGSQVAQVHLGWQVGKIVFLFSRQALLTDEPSRVRVSGKPGSGSWPSCPALRHIEQRPRPNACPSSAQRYRRSPTPHRYHRRAGPLE